MLVCRLLLLSLRIEQIQEMLKQQLWIPFVGVHGSEELHHTSILVVLGASMYKMTGIISKISISLSVTDENISINCHTKMPMNQPWIFFTRFTRFVY